MRRLLLLAGSVAVLLLLPASARAQGNSPVTVDDSPSALLLLQRAVDQATPNPADSVRAIQELLDELGDKLVPAGDGEPDRFVSARRAAHRLLTSRPALLDRYRVSEGARARALLERSELELLWRTRLLTPAGLTGGLLLAERWVEQAHFAAARSILEELARHPELREEDTDGYAQFLRLRGMVAHGTGNATDAADALTRLQALTGPVATACREVLERLINGGVVAERTGRGALDDGIAAPPDPTTWHLISVTQMPGSLYGRQYAAAEGSGHLALRGVDRARLIGSLLTASPTVSGEIAFVNEGSTVRAFDRLSARPRWVSTIGGGSVGRDGSPAGDLNSIAIAGDRMVTLDGHAHATERSSSGRVTCLDVSTGTLLWSAAIDRLGGPEMAGLAPHGAPLIVDGAVFVLARKVTPRFEIVSYLVALDLADGTLQWARHLCAAGGARLSGLRAHTTLSAADGALFATLSTGAVARVEARSGEITWLLRIPVPIRDPRYVAEPWEISGAVPMGRGVLAIAPDLRRVLLLDAADGVELESQPIEVGQGFGLARYLLVTTDRLGREIVIAVGSDVIAFDADDLASPLWNLQSNRPELRDDPEGRAGVRGRVQAAGEHLAIPLADRVLVVGADDGRLVHEVPITGPGNPLLLGPQLFLATHDAVECHMPFADAERLIRDRVRNEPAVAEHGLALASLGLRARSLQTALDGAEAAVAAMALRNAEPGLDRDRNDLFLLLLTINESGLAATEEDGGALHALLGSLATEPWQRAMHRLVHGDWFAMRAVTDRAMAMWQEVMDDDELALAQVPVGEARLPAHRAARLRQQALAERIGAVVREKIDAAAEAALIELLVSEPSAAQLLALSRRYPESAVAEVALLRAATSAERQGDARAAIATLLWGWRERFGTGAHRREIVGTAITLAIRQSWWTTAMDLIDTIETEDGAAATDVPRWRQLLADAGGGSDASPPRLGALAGAGRELRGGLVPPTPGGRQPAFHDRILLADGADLLLVDAELSERWRVTLPGAEMETLRADPRGVIVLVRTPETSILVSLDPETGQERWRSSALDELLPAPRMRQSGDRPGPADQAVPLALADGIVLVRRDGTLAMLEIAEGVSVRWQLTSAVRAIGAAALHDGALVLAGRASDDEDDLIVVIDPSTGREVAVREPRLGGQVRWLSLTATGLATLGTDGGIESFDALAVGDESALVWSLPAAAVRGSLRGWSTSEWLLVAGANEGIVPVRLSDGEPMPSRFLLPDQVGAPPARDVHWDRAGVIVLLDQRVAEFTHDGLAVGADAAVDDRDYRLMALADGMVIVVSGTGSLQVEIAPGVHRTQYDHRIYRLDRRSGLRLDGPPLQVGSIARRFDRVTTIDGWLLLSNGLATVVLPMPADIPAGQPSGAAATPR